MPWVSVLLRGTPVFAKVKDSGEFDVEDGRVEVRYRKGESPAYRANIKNLTRAPDAQILPEETCSGSSAPAPPPSKKRTAQPAAAAAQWVAYTDGACTGNPGPAGSGFIVVAPDGKHHEGFEFLGTATNNIAELSAILRAVQCIPADAESIAVHTDSQYAIGVLTKGWKAKVNQELIATIRGAISERARFSLLYVPGHAGVPLNERADELARGAITSKKTSLPKVKTA